MAYRTIQELIEQSSSFGKENFIEIRKRLRTLRYTYSDIDTLTGKACAYFAKHAKKGDRIAIWGPNSPEWVVAFLGALRFGLVAVPIDFRTSKETASKFIAQTKPKLLIVSALLPIKGIVLEDFLKIISEFEPAKGNKIIPTDLAEILYTSGTTGIPKGVMLTHGNLISSISSMNAEFPITKELKTLSILPLSHIFEQIAGLFVPYSNGAKIAYLNRINSATIIEGMNRHKVTCMLVVPRILSLLLTAIETKAEKEKRPLKQAMNLAKSLPQPIRKSIFFKIHKTFGGKLKFFVSGGAPLEERILQSFETFGFDVYQGYGATETAGLATLNFGGAKRASYCGKAGPGVEIKIADDGEVLVKGDSVSPGYYNNNKKTKDSFEGGWYKTGDIGALDGDWLKLLGREKFRIVLSDGRKIYPEDIETKLGNHPEVLASCVIAIMKGNEKEAYASIIAKNPKRLPKIIEEINKNIDPAQQIMNFGAWPSEDFPRLRTLKINREEVQKIIQSKEKYAPEKKFESSDVIINIISRVSRVNASKIKDNSNLVTNLKMDSLARIELISQLEEELGVMVDESKISTTTTVSDIKKIVKNSEFFIRTKRNDWNHTLFFSIVRLLLQKAIVFPYHGLFAQLKINGRENIPKGPCIFYSNHIGTIDAFVAVKAIGARRGMKLIVAADSKVWKDNPLYAFLFDILIGAYPISTDGPALREFLEYIGEKMDEGYSLLIYPEGRTAPDGNLLEFMKGTGMIAVEMGVPAIPIKNGKNFQEIFPMNQTWTAIIPHSIQKVEVKVGKPQKFAEGTKYEDATLEMHKRLKEL